MFFLVSHTFVVVWQPSEDITTSHLILYELKTGHKKTVSGNWLPDDQKKDSDGQQTEYAILCANFSRDGKRLAVCDNRKQLFVFEVNAVGDQWKQLFKSKVDRNCIKLIFAKNKNSVICGHKSGDVFEFEFENEKTEQSVSGRLLLGHCSMLLDLMQSPDSKYLITCDRDEKIRVSRYPNCYTIESYCLGHKEFVSSLDFINETTLVSGSGDGSIRLWNTCDGKELNCIMCDSKETVVDNATKGTQFAVKKLVTNIGNQNSATLLAISFYNQSLINIYSIDSSLKSLKLVNSLTVDEEPINIMFDCNRTDILWVLMSKNENCLSIYQIDEQITKCNIYESIVEQLNANENFVKQCINDKQNGELNGLYKHWFNNVEVYLQKKTERQEVMAKKKKFVAF